MKLLFFLASLFVTTNVFSQSVGIGISTPNASAQLDVFSTNKGVVLPRVNLLSPTDVTTIVTPIVGLIVYNSNGTLAQMPDGPGYYYWSGTKWLKFLNGGTSAGSGWLTTGNSGTSTSNFIGTTDNQMLQFRVSNLPSGFIQNSGTNTAYGFQTLSSLTSGSTNSAFGWKALLNTTTGGTNSAFGSQGLLQNTIGQSNTALGFNVLSNNISGNSNVGAGIDVMYANVDGISNVAMGAMALFNNQHGSNLVAIGDSALFNDLGNPGFGGTGQFNTAVGSKALYSNTTGVGNSGFGSSVLYSLNTGNSNTAVGESAMWAMQTGSQNIAIGRQSFSGATTGSDNVVIGSFAIPYSSTGDRNHAMGTFSLTQNTSGHDNVGIGYRAAYNNSSGLNNTAVGCNALENSGSEQRNTAIGKSAGAANANGNYCTFLGAFSDASGSFSNSMALGDAAQITASNQVRVGDNGITSIGGQVGWTSLSDARFKINVEENIPGLDFILKLRPVSYQFDRAAMNQFLKIDNNKNTNSPIDQARFTGFLAQEVEAVANGLGFNFSGIDKPKNANDPYGLRYAEFVVPIIKAMQEQQQQIEDLQKENASLEARLKALEDKMR